MATIEKGLLCEKLGIELFLSLFYYDDHIDNYLSMHIPTDNKQY